MDSVSVIVFVKNALQQSSILGFCVAGFKPPKRTSASGAPLKRKPEKRPVGRPRKKPKIGGTFELETNDDEWSEWVQIM